MTNSTQSAGEMTVTLPNDLEIFMVREFDAEPSLIWEAFTDAELFAEWIGPRESQIVVEKMEVRVGGDYRYSSPAPDGESYVFTGEYIEVAKPTRLVSTFNFSFGEFQPAPATDALTLIPLDNGRTRLEITSTFASKEERDGKLQSGMERGMNDGFEKLDAILTQRANDTR